MEDQAQHDQTAPLERPELLAPAGDRDCAEAAAENGADAVYFGLSEGFNARARAANFTLDALPELMAWLHRQGMRGYAALNTLVFSHELDQVEQTLRRIAEAGANAVLVQDFGVARLARAVSPDLPLHASTQMSLTSAEGIRAAESLGIERVVLARELSIAEIAQIRGQTDVGLEAFVHGALCISYSGQCLASASLGGRSANRGQCAQACRMAYELVCDGKRGQSPFAGTARRVLRTNGGCPLFLDLGDKRYLLSPQDLAAYDLVGELIRAGVSALKIEGRMKSAEYVATITRHYRKSIDAAMAGRRAEFSAQEIEDLELSFSRGLGHGWLEGKGSGLVSGVSSDKRGLYLGEVKAVARGRVAIEPVCTVRRGDGVMFQRGRDEQTEQGGRVYEIFVEGRPVKEAHPPGIVELSFGREAVDWRRLCVGQRVWKTDDPHLAKRLRKTQAAERPPRRIPLDLIVSAAVGRCLQIEARAASGAACRIESPQVLNEAIKHPLSADQLREQFGRLGETCYELRDVECHIEGRPMVPLSVLGQLRREMIRQLDAAASRPPLRTIAPGSPLRELRAAVGNALCGVPRTSGGVPPSPQEPNGTEAVPYRDDSLPRGRGQPQLHVLCRGVEQLRSVLAHGVTSVIADFRNLGQYGEAVRIARDAGAEILLATPRIQKPRETGSLHAIQRRQPDGVLARNLGGLAFFAQAGATVVADFSLGAANEISFDWLRRQGASRVAACHDLARRQLFDLVAAMPPEWIEVVVHHHMPMFHTEHCVFCAALSPGTDKSDCGRPCDRHAVALRDHAGAEHLLLADAACRNTLFNRTAQTAAELVPELVRRGVVHFRIELLEGRSDHETGEVIGTYVALLAGRTSGRQAWKRLQTMLPGGITRGTLDPRRRPDAPEPVAM